jgi:DNA-binding NarL/FixJ family response regulator
MMSRTHEVGLAGPATPPGQCACLLVEDQTLIAQLLAATLRAMPGIGSVTLAATVAAAVAKAAERDLDLVILDLKLPDGDGRSVIKAVAALHPQAACIVLSSAADEFTCPTELARHVVALIDKTAPLDTLRREVEAVVIRRFGGEPTPTKVDPIKALRRRELEVFERIGKGMSTREIAESLGISVHTVNTYRKAIVAKLRVVGAELVRRATLHVAIRPSDDPPAPWRR